MHECPTTVPSSTASDDQIRELLAARSPGHTLPQALYMSDAAFDFDMRAVFSRQWIQAGLEAEVPKAGDYVTREFGTTSIIVVRDNDGSVKAHLNTCRHRGAKLCAEAKGSSRRIVCPYHQWTYELNGSLMFARNMGENFARAEHGLNSVRCETVAGVIYIALSDDAPDFAPFRAALEPLLSPHNLKDAKIAFSVTLLEDANWKLVMENARECYHCHAQHPELLKAFRDPTKDDYFAGNPPWMIEFRDVCASIGIPTGPVEGAWYDMMRIPLAEGVESLTFDGKPASKKPLISDCTEHIGTMRWAAAANAFSHALKDYAFTFEIWPISATQTKVVSHWLVHKDAVEGVDYDKDHLGALWIATNDQDKWLSENNHQGVAGVGYVPGPYSPIDEQKVIDFVDWYCGEAKRYLES